MSKVKESQSTAFGIVDRDILLADPNFQNSFWCEIDDDVFITQKPYGSAIFVLHRWEMESYLFHPKALELLVTDKTLTYSTSASTIANLLCQNENDMVAVTLLSTIPTKTGKSQVSEQFGENLSGIDLMTKICQQLNIIPNDILAEKALIHSFAEDKTDPIERWHKLSRMLDGKRIMYRIEKLLSSPGCKISLKSERGALAGHIAKHKLIDPALSNWLYDIYNTGLTT